MQTRKGASGCRAWMITFSRAGDDRCRALGHGSHGRSSSDDYNSEQYAFTDATNMSDTEQREIAEAFFEQKQSREHLKDAIKLDEARRAAMVKNLYRLRNRRLSRNQASTQERQG